MLPSRTDIRTRFANRFEPEGEGYLFRANLRAPGYRVTAAERDRMVAEFARRMTWLSWSAPAVMVPAFAAIAWEYVSRGQDAPQAVIWLMIAGVGIAVVVLSTWLWNAPVRELHGRAAAVAGRSKAEARRVALERLTWRQLGASVLMAALFLWRMGRRANLLVGWNRVWLALAGVLVLGVAVQAARKLLQERRR